GRINVLGLVFPGDAFLSMEFYIQEIIKGVSEATKKKGYQLMLFTQGQFNGSECLKLYMSKLVAGFILPSIGKNNFKDVSKLKVKKVPLVLLCSHIDNISSFDCDNVTGGYLATKHLLDSGRKRIAFIHGHKNWIDAADRFKGYKKALKEKGMQITKEYVLYNYDHNNHGKTAIKKLLSLQNPPDALFTVNDVMALAVMPFIKQAGKKVPQDIAVIGFDNIPSCENSSPSLTTVAQPVKKMAFAAAENLIEIISSGKKKSYSRFFKPKLVVRESA
ncbi:MAG: substrate-binding domain-containing protein, partial [Candidatus Auribacterota bacterium]|nr:substrate-binding domain-containing protein [Candidatus Auribacterota bacterium]